MQTDLSINHSAIQTNKSWKEKLKILTKIHDTNGLFKKNSF